VTLKFSLKITQGHSNWYHSKASVPVSYSPSIVTMALNCIVVTLLFTSLPHVSSDVTRVKSIYLVLNWGLNDFYGAGSSLAN